MPYTLRGELANGPWQFQMDGAPKPILPILKQLRRFDRPFITEDPFETYNPAPFVERCPDGQQAVEDEPPARATRRDDAETRRDPRVHNTVVHADFPLREANAQRRELEHEEWLDNAPERLESVEAGELYLIYISEKEGELKLGLAQMTGEKKRNANETRIQYKILWFARTGKNFCWGQRPTFKHHMASATERGHDYITIESVIMAVTDNDLTPASKV